MALFPIDNELYHVSVVNVPDDTNNYAVKDEYVRNLADILNEQKSELTVGLNESTDNYDTKDNVSYVYCYLNPGMFSPTYNNDGTPKNEVILNSILIDINAYNESPVKDYTVDIDDKTWKNLTKTINPHVTPIHIRIITSLSEGTMPDITHIAINYSDITLTYTTNRLPNPTPDEPDLREGFYSGTGIVYTGTTINDFVHVLVRMKLQEVDGKHQAVITVTELPKDLSGGGGSVNAVATKLPDGTANLSFS